MTTVTDKQEAERLLRFMPEDSTLEDIQYHFYVLEKIRRGQADIATGRSHTEAEARARMNRWLQR